jgi:hypothetical protein
MIIAIDFDGTIVEDAYPGIGKPKRFAMESMKELIKDGHQLILWTYRYGERLQEAVDFCAKQGVEFYSINASHPEELFEEGVMSRKIHADIFVDDRMIGGFPGWGEIVQRIRAGKYQKDFQQKLEQSRRRRGFFRR